MLFSGSPWTGALGPAGRVAGWIVAAGAIVLACSSPEPVKAAPTPSPAFLGGTQRVVLEVDYAPGAAPYVGDVPLLFPDVWVLSQSNLERLLPGKTVTIPHKIEEMEALDDPGTTEFTADAVLALAKTHRGQKTEGAVASFYAVWLRGYYKDDKGVVHDDVLGISIGDTGVLALFKPVIQSGALPGVSATSRILEQATLIHELGHTLGLVNNGISMVTPHQDVKHGAHCTNPKCIMYWENEGRAYASNFVKDYVKTGNDVLFGPECLADTDRAGGKK